MRQQIDATTTRDMLFNNNAKSPEIDPKSPEESKSPDQTLRKPQEPIESANGVPDSVFESVHQCLRNGSDSDISRDETHLMASETDIVVNDTENVSNDSDNMADFGQHIDNICEDIEVANDAETESHNASNDVHEVTNTSDKTDDSCGAVLDTDLEVIDGCVYPPYDPPADKTLRYTNQLQFLRTIMTKYLCRYKTALPFLKPVNCVVLKIPDYYKVITRPMDMLTIKRRMLCLWYQSAEECLKDFKLMFNNCYKFNSCDSFVYTAGKKLEEYLEEKLKEMPTEEIEIACPAKSTVAERKAIDIYRQTIVLSLEAINRLHS